MSGRRSSTSSSSSSSSWRNLKAMTSANGEEGNGKNAAAASASTAADDDDVSNKNASTTKQPLPSLDYGAMGRYAVAFVIQMGFIKTFLTGIDLTVVPFLLGKFTTEVPFFVVNFVFFYGLALKSRVFNPMSNARPKPATKEIEIEIESAVDDDNKDGDTPNGGGGGPVDEAPRKMPSWTPPGVVFPIVWLLIIGPLRATSSSLVVSELLSRSASASAGSSSVYGSTTIMALMAHLSIGDIWNTINNTERRYGTSVLGVALVWISAAFAAYQYYQVVPLAGTLLSLPLVWLSIASSLIFRTWQLNNPNPVTGRSYSLLPRLEQQQQQGEEGRQTKTITKLIWFEK